jgi:hypothetical protein
MKNYFFFPATYALLFLCSCTKDQMPAPLESLTVTASRSSTSIFLLSETAEKMDSETSCENIPFEENFVSIRYRIAEGGVSPPLCITETELNDILLKAGYSQSEAEFYLKSLFQNDTTATPQLANLIGNCIYLAYPLPADYIPECFSINAIGREDYPGQGSWLTDCAPGFIDQYTVRQAKAGNGCQLVLEGGFSGIRLKNKITGQILTLAFSSSLNDFIEPLMVSGYNPGQAEGVVQGILYGKYSMREVWNLFQFSIAPNLPVVQSIPPEELDDWELWHVGIGIYAGNSTIVSFYFAQGNAPVNCKQIIPLDSNIPLDK